MTRITRRARTRAPWIIVALLGLAGPAVFADAGQVTANGPPFAGTWRVGVGAGARYYTPIGPIRLDVAFPLNRQPGGDSFELYIGIGQAF